jgi:hypothetical protein
VKLSRRKTAISELRKAARTAPQLWKPALSGDAMVRGTRIVGARSGRIRRKGGRPADMDVSLGL